MDERAFIRTAMLPPEPPPLRESGAAKWLRENLFSGWLNSLLTIVGAVVVVWLCALALPWLRHSVWNATSLGECRDIVAGMGGESGACWAVIKARWHQYLFGFYPPELYWRPVLALGLLLVALAPVLYWNNRNGAWLTLAAGIFTVVSMVLLSTPGTIDLITLALMGGLFAVAWFAPKRLIWVTVLYPFVGFWLLWGGPVMGPVAIFATIALIVWAVAASQPRIGSILATLLAVALVVAAFLNPVATLLDLGGWIAGLITGEQVRLDPGIGGYALRDLTPFAGLISDLLQGVTGWGLIPVNSDEFGGFLLAFVIGVTSISFSLPLGVLLALGRQSDMFLVKTLSVGFIEFIRGVPLITLLFTASLLLAYFLPPGTNFDLILRVIILASLFSAAYLAEVIRGGLAALPRGQYEAADALGLTYWQAQRLIIMPQALKISIPGIVSTFIGLFKDTTLVSFIGLLDPLRGVTMAVRADINWKGIYWEPYIFVGAIFFLICFGMSRYSMYLERKLKTDHR
jgi:general L-amino acid transport system permease protein